MTSPSPGGAHVGSGGLSLPERWRFGSCLSTSLFIPRLRSEQLRLVLEDTPPGLSPSCLLPPLALSTPPFSETTTPIPSPLFTSPFTLSCGF